MSGWIVRYVGRNRWHVLEPNPDHGRPGTMHGHSGEFLVVQSFDNGLDAHRCAARHNGGHGVDAA